MSSEECFNLDQSKILSSGNGLTGNKLPTHTSQIWHKIHIECAMNEQHNMRALKHTVKSFAFRKVTPFPDKKILALSKLKAIADDNFTVAQRWKFSLIGGKTLWGEGEGENAGSHHFSSFPTMFSFLSKTEIIVFNKIEFVF